MLLASSGDTAEVVEAIVAVGTLLVVIFKARAIRGFFQKITTGTNRAAVNSAAVDVVELLRTEVGELRTQLAEVRAQNLDKDLKISSLETSLRVLREEVTGEAPIRVLAEKIDGLASTVTEGINALLERKDGHAA